MKGRDMDFIASQSQKEAINWGEGPVMILAGPGSGKTSVLTHRIARLIKDSQGKYFNIVGLTFSNKAADQMRECLKKLLPRERDMHRVQIDTFHSFAAQNLCQHGSHIGLTPSLSVLSDKADQAEVVKSIIGHGGAGDVDKILRLFDVIYLKKNGSSFSLEAQDIEAKYDQSIHKLHKTYQDKLIEANQLDFPNLLYFFCKLMKKRPSIARSTKVVYPYVCVDEFQDTNIAQYEVLKAVWGDKTDNVFVVADDDQIIYQWNGASYQRFKDFEKDFSDAKIHLPESYRCPEKIVTLANSLIVHNKTRSRKEPLRSKTGSDNKSVEVKGFLHLDEELQWVAQDIKQNHSKNTSEVVVLARTSRVLAQMADKLQAVNLKPYLKSSKIAYESPPMIILVSLLKMLSKASDLRPIERLARAWNSLFDDVVNLDVIKDVSQANGDSYLKTFVSNGVGSSGEGVKQLGAKIKKMASKYLVQSINHSSFINEYLKMFDSYESKQCKPDSSASSQGKDVLTLWEVYKEERKVWNQMMGAQSFHGVDELLQAMDLSSKTRPPEWDEVRCLTIHAAKGLEFDHVYLVGMVEGLLPSFQSLEGDKDNKQIQEERRNCFVAITRTKKRLTLSYSRECFGYTKKLSRFLNEMGLSLPISCAAVATERAQLRKVAN